MTTALDHQPGKSVNGTETVRDQIAIPEIANADRWRKFRDIFGLRHYLQWRSCRSPPITSLARGIALGVAVLRRIRPSDLGPC